MGDGGCENWEQSLFRKEYLRLKKGGTKVSYHLIGTLEDKGNVFGEESEGNRSLTQSDCDLLALWETQEHEMVN